MPNRCTSPTGSSCRHFFRGARPDELNRQGPDTGTQYRSAIFHANAEQKKVADGYIAQLQKADVFPRPIATQVEPLNVFYDAEAYHQNYLAHHPKQPHIVINDLPKIAALKRRLPSLYADQ
jgi:peptide-methionine (S)-S-oxide reductase